MEVGTAMLAGSGLDFLGGLLGSSGRGKAARQQLQHQLFLDREARAFNDKWAERSEAFARDSRDRRVQIAAADARAAGLHPLFALGAAQGGSPGFMAGQSSSGSAASAAVSDSGPGGALRAAGSALQRYASTQQTKQQLEANELDLRLKRANAETAEFELEQLRTSAAQGAAMRGLTHVPDVGAVMEAARTGNVKVPYRLPTGEVAKILNPESFDEISQFDIAWELAKMYGRQWQRNVKDWWTGSNTGAKYRETYNKPLKIHIRRALGGRE